MFLRHPVSLLNFVGEFGQLSIKLFYFCFQFQLILSLFDADRLQNAMVERFVILTVIMLVEASVTD